MKRVVLALVVACRPPQPPVKVMELNVAGEAVNVEGAVVNGYVTLVDFWSESCAPCLVVAKKVEAEIANEPRVVLRKVDVGDGFTPIAKTYKIGALPHWRVFDVKGRLRFILVGPDCLRAPGLAKQLLAEP